MLNHPYVNISLISSACEAEVTPHTAEPTVGPLIIGSPWARKRVSTGALEAMDDL